MMSNLGIFLRRYFVAFSFAAVVTSALVLLMEQLIRPDFAEVVAQPPPTTINFHRVIEEPPIPEKPTLVKPPRVLPPPVVALLQPADSSDGTYDFDPVVPGPINPKINPSAGQADGGLLPIALVAPNYPERARRSGIQGYVVVEFTVDVTGAVRDARVIESQPNSIFDRAALLSVERSKYRPKRNGGRALVVHGVRKRVSFTLEG